MPYGYLGQNTPNQTVSNSGVFSISDVASLEKQGKFGGSLELIEEQTASSDTSIDFTDLKNYDVHLLTWNYQQQTTQERLYLRYSNDGGSTFTSSGYQYALTYGSATGSNFTDIKSTSDSDIRVAGSGAANDTVTGYMYLYNTLNSSKYSFVTFQASFWLNLSGYYYLFQFGGGVLPTAETHNAIRLFTKAGSMTGTFKLYGVKQL